LAVGDLLASGVDDGIAFLEAAHGLVEEFFLAFDEADDAAWGAVGAGLADGF